MENAGETIVGECLRWVNGCNFVDYNIKTGKKQGEIDVIGLNFSQKRAYVCEVATHMQTGLNYVDPKTGESDNVNRFLKKFSKDIEYARGAFPGYGLTFMLWVPLVKINQTGMVNQQRDIESIVSSVKSSHAADIKVVSNLEYYSYLEKLVAVARKEKKEMMSPIMRFLQVHQKLKKYLTYHKKL